MKPCDLVRVSVDLLLQEKNNYGSKRIDVKVVKDSMLLVLDVRHYTHESCYEMMCDNKIFYQPVVDTAVKAWELIFERVAE